MTWSEYWNTESTLYANARHKRAHYETISRDILKFVSGTSPRIVDYGCGDTIFANRIAEACGHLFLCDGSPRVRKKSALRYADWSNISIINPIEFCQLKCREIDTIIMNSVAQYLSMADFVAFLAISHDKLKPGGRLVLADIVPPNVGLLDDATELMGFAHAYGFRCAAAISLIRSYFSRYRTIRQAVGFLQFDERDVLRVLDEAGFSARRHYPNFGHNSRRMAFSATARHHDGTRPDYLGIGPSDQAV